MVQFYIRPDRHVFVRCDRAAIGTTVYELIMQCHHLGKRPKLGGTNAGR